MRSKWYNVRAYPEKIEPMFDIILKNFKQTPEVVIY
jgi:hypothetical protein